MIRRWLPLALFSFLVTETFLVAESAPAWAQEAVRVPGTQLSLVPPEGFEVAKRFPGLQNEPLLASIMVTEIGEGVGALESGLTEAELAPKGLTLQEAKDLKLGTHSGRLVRVEQSLRGAVYEKWMGLIGNQSKSVLVAATYPRDFAPQLRDVMRGAIESASWNPDLELSRFDGLPFRIEESARLEIIDRSHALLTLSTSGTKIPVPASEPFLVVGASFNPIAIDDLEEFSKQRLGESRQLEEIEGVEGAALQLDSRPAYELKASAKEVGTGNELVVYQLVVSDGSDYAIVQGVTPRARSEEFLREFESVGHSLTFP